MLTRRTVSPLPPDYGKCCQTVTVYHLREDSTVQKTVLHGVSLQLRKNYNVDKTGATESTSFLLVIPAAVSSGIPVAVGDKVLSGEGGEIQSRQEWAELIPSKVPGMAVIRYVEPIWWEGRLCHTEAGGIQRYINARR